MTEIVRHLPDFGKEKRFNNFRYSHLEQIWKARREFNIFKTENGIYIIGGNFFHPPYNSMGFESKKRVSVYVDGHSHPTSKRIKINNPDTGIADILSLKDWVVSVGLNTKDVILLYKGGALQVTNLKKDSGLKNTWFLQSVIERFLESSYAKKKYKPNKHFKTSEGYSAHSVVNEFYERNILNSPDPLIRRETALDVLKFASTLPDVVLKRYDLRDPDSPDTISFLAIYNNKNVKVSR